MVTGPSGPGPLEAEDPLGLRGPEGPELYDHYKSELVRFLTRFPAVGERDREDIAQESMRRTHKYFVDRPGELDQARGPLPFMKTTAGNLAKDLLMKLKGEVLVDDDAVLDQPVRDDEREVTGSGRDPDLWPHPDDEVMEALQKAATGLSPQQIRVVDLIRQGQVDDDIAQTLGVPKNQVHQQRHRVKVRFQEMEEVRRYTRPRYLEEDRG